jgi:nicotinate-nucleotide adenylyltransferase
LSTAQTEPARQDARRPRRVALFGGTFDPVHAGHIAVARAAARRFRLDQVLFVPSSRPPHKKAAEMAAFEHRLAMVALACAGQPRCAPSLLESGDGGQNRISYSVDTVTRYKRQCSRPGDTVYFLLGADSFLHIQTWKNYTRLLGLCDFIVASRPGFRWEALYGAIPAELLAEPLRRNARGLSGGARSIRLHRSTIHILDTVASHVSATDVRRRIEHGQRIHGLVPANVEEYINKVALYR